ncbi:MAG: hypothetical protein QXJ75_05795 [Candidatus Bathyarchaeia archaeon]
MSVAQEVANAPFDEMIRDLLLAMVSAQNEANKSFIAGVEELSGTEVVISYKKTTDSTTENREISGNALAFGILPTLLQIQNGLIEIKMAVTITRNITTTVGVKAKARFLFYSASVDAKYQNTYSYKAEASSLIRITVAPAPPPQPLMEAIKKVAESAPPVDKPAGTG